jgi:uncharacterized protein
MAMRSKVTAFLFAVMALLVFPLPSRADDAPQKHFLWKVTSGKSVVYLFGTIHVGKPDFYPLPAVVEDSFKRADTLVEEIKPDPSDAMLRKKFAAEHGLYPGSETIANHLGEETIRRLAIYLKRKSWQEQQIISKMRPSMIASMIKGESETRLGLDKEHGLDKHFATEAENSHKPLEALETAAFQEQLLSDMASEVEDSYLLQTLVDAQKPISNLEMIIDAWRSGDAEKMQELSDQSYIDYPQLKPFKKKVLDDRNDAMAKKIEQFLTTNKTYFVAVGAAHMVGEHGLVSLLKAAGFTVEQL